MVLVGGIPYLGFVLPVQYYRAYDFCYYGILYSGHFDVTHYIFHYDVTYEMNLCFDLILYFVWIQFCYIYYWIWNVGTYCPSSLQILTQHYYWT